MEHRLEHRGNIAAGGQIRFAHALDEALRRVVADESHRELARDEPRSRGARGQKVQQVASFALAILLELLAQRLLCARLMSVGIEYEAATALRAIDCPAGKDARDLDDVGLR